MKVQLGLLINSQRAVIKLVGGQYQDETGVLKKCDPDLSAALSCLLSDLGEQFEKRLKFWNTWLTKIIAPINEIQKELAAPDLTAGEITDIKARLTEATDTANASITALGKSVVALHGVDKIPIALLAAEKNLNLTPLDVNLLKQWLIDAPEVKDDGELDEIPAEFAEFEPDAETDELEKAQAELSTPE